MAQPRNHHWIVVVTRNALTLTKKAIPSMLRQEGLDGYLHLLAVDNGSSDNTVNYLLALSGQGEPVSVRPINPQRSLAHAWNTALTYIFSTGAQHALVVNNDVWLRPDTYAGLLTAGGEFVTAVGERVLDNVRDAEPNLQARRPHPDFSCFLIKRSVWSKVGPFDERFLGAYCEDADYHCRMHVAGIHAESVSLPFWHVAGGAGTLKFALEEERERIQKRADMNRTLFAMKWGFEIGSREYGEFFERTPGIRDLANSLKGMRAAR